MVLQKPFLKWIGGKTQMIETVLSKFPESMNNYHEIFLGGGSVLLAMLSLKAQGKIHITNKIYAYDINLNLINVFKNIQENKDLLYEYLLHHINEYSNITGHVINRTPNDLIDAKTSKESYYYWVRNRYNNMDKTCIECSALFIFINKTCFRGMYREGPNGFNVPYGHYKKCPSFVSKSELNNIYNLIQDVIFIHLDFRESLSRVNEGDFIYLDPPYFPENKKSFVGYASVGFSIETHYKLFKQIKDLDFIKFMLNNSRVDEVLNYFDNKDDYIVDNVIARRAIHCKNPGSIAAEVIIRNFRN